LHIKIKLIIYCPAWLQGSCPPAEFGSLSVGSTGQSGQEKSRTYFQMAKTEMPGVIRQKHANRCFPWPIKKSSAKIMRPTVGQASGYINSVSSLPGRNQVFQFDLFTRDVFKSKNNCQSGIRRNFSSQCTFNCLINIKLQLAISGSVCG